MVPLESQIDNEHCPHGPHTILNRNPLLQKISLVYKKGSIANVSYNYICQKRKYYVLIELSSV